MGECEEKGHNFPQIKTGETGCTRCGLHAANAYTLERDARIEAQRGFSLRMMLLEGERLTQIEDRVDMLGKKLEHMASAITAGGFRVGLDLLGVPTLWCIECGRDSGMHWDTCSKAEKSKAAVVARVEASRPVCRCSEYMTCEVCLAVAPKPKLGLTKETVVNLTPRVEGPPTKAPPIDDAQGIPFHTNSLQCGYRPGGER